MRDAADEDDADDMDADASRDDNDDAPPSEQIAYVRPFENLAELPDDLADAFESFKLAILRHKTSGWVEISRDDVLASLDALKALAVTPSAEAAAF